MSEPSIGMGNPAAIYCEEHGGTSVLSSDGTIGYCILPGGQKCEEWAFYRGKCGVGVLGTIRRFWYVPVGLGVIGAIVYVVTKD